MVENDRTTTAGSLATGATINTPNTPPRPAPAQGAVNATARGLYGQPDGNAIPAALRHVIDAHDDDDRVKLGLDATAIAAKRVRQARFLGETGAADDPLLGEVLIDAEYAADIADARGVEVDPTQAQRASEETRRQLIGQFGDEETDRLLARTRAWLRTQPTLSALLARRGLGNEPGVIVPLVQYVRRRWL
jgi:hypothetical protein